MKIKNKFKNKEFSFFFLIFEISKFQNIGRSTRRKKNGIIPCNSQGIIP